MRARSTKSRTPKWLMLLLTVLISVVAFVIAFALVYAAYVFISYDRIEDNIESELIESESAIEKAEIGKTYTALSQNVGFGAYSPDFTFFLDGGKESWAGSKEEVIENINKAADTILSYDPDFVFIQEVDFDSTRSYHVDQKAMLREKCGGGYSSVFAVNFDSAFLLYPFDQPHGTSRSGILSLSKYKIQSSIRRSLPISKGVSKLFDLDRAYTVSRIETDNGHELIIYNVHFSAYGGSEKIRAAQMTMLFDDMKNEYEKGNYCLCAGDFNHDLTGDSVTKLNGEDTSRFGWTQSFPFELLPDCLTVCKDYKDGKLEPTCRNCDVPYKEGNFTVIVDGFIISDNIKAEEVENINTHFAYSDHNPVKLVFTLMQ